MRDWMYNFTILDFDTMVVSGQLHAPAVLLPEIKSPSLIQ
jgi:hypothetical protein